MKSRRVRPVSRLIGQCGDWVCLPRRLLYRWLADKREVKGQSRPLAGGIDYNTFIYAPVENGGWSAHQAGPSTLFRFSGFEATIFRNGPSGLMLNRHTDAVNHEFEDVARRTGEKPEIVPPQDFKGVHKFRNWDRNWILFFGMHSVHCGPGFFPRLDDLKIIQLKLPVGDLELRMGWAQSIPIDLNREVSVFEFRPVEASGRVGFNPTLRPVMPHVPGPCGPWPARAG